MTPIPLPPDEERRHRALVDLRLLDTLPEERFDRITDLALKMLGGCAASVSLIDSERQWLKSVAGFPLQEGRREASFCAHTIMDDEILVVEDATIDPRFKDNPLVLGEPHIRFYAGRPLRAVGGERVGTLCVIDHLPRSANRSEQDVLEALGRWAETELQAEQLCRAIEVINDMDRARDEFATRISHAIRTPLTTLTGYLEALVEGEAGCLNSQQEAFADAALQSARRLSEVALEFANRQTGWRNGGSST